MVACGSLVAHRVQSILAQKRGILTAAAEPVAALSARDWAIAAGILAVGVAAILLVRPAPVPEAAPAGTSRAGRISVALALWSIFAALSVWLMALHPRAALVEFLAPCAILVLPARTYARHHRGESEWVLWIIAGAAIVLGLTRDPRYTWGLLAVALLFTVVAAAQDRRRARRASA